MARNNESKNAGVTELEQKLLSLNDELALIKSFMSAVVSENDSHLASNKRLHAENSSLKQRIAALEEELKKFTDN